MLSLMTICQRKTSSYCLRPRNVEMSSGLLCWRRHMPSTEPRHTLSRKSVQKVQKRFTNIFLSLCVSFRLCGSYANMRGWSSSDAFKDFTGGVNQIYYPTEPNAPSCDELWLTLSRATKCKSLICCTTSRKEVRNKFLEKQ